jgi:hypothetical protein
MISSSELLTFPRLHIALGLAASFFSPVWRFLKP